MLPVAELHIHIEGALEPELLVRLAERNDVPLPTTDSGELRARYKFDNLQSFLDIHYSNLRVLRAEPDFYDLASAYLARAAAAGVRRAELFFDPQTHVAHGVPLAEVFGGLTAALADGEREHGVSSALILCFLRDQGAEAAEEVLRAALPFRDQFIGVGLDSTEIGYPPALFGRVYDMAAAEGLRRVAHAGEEGGPDYVREALDYCTWSASTTGSGPWRTRGWSPSCGTGRSRSRCARCRTSRCASWTPWATTCCPPCWTPGCSRR